MALHPAYSFFAQGISWRLAFEPATHCVTAWFTNNISSTTPIALWGTYTCSTRTYEHVLCSMPLDWRADCTCASEWGKNTLFLWTHAPCCC